MTDRYDAGLLNDYGGGNVEWWHDYIRAELDRSEEFYADEITRLREELASLQSFADKVGAICNGHANENDRLRARCAELREGLMPFGKAADNFDSFNIKNAEEWFAYGGAASPAKHDPEGAITVADLRRARTLLEKNDEDQ